MQELEITARAHGVPTPSLTPETKELATAAERILGSSMMRTRSPNHSAATTPISPRFYSGNDQIADMLRQSPGIDLSKLNIKAGSVSYYKLLLLLLLLLLLFSV